jgi:hypothetical protein
MPEMSPQAKNFFEEAQKEFGDGDSLPQNFPEDVPVYAGAKITAAGRLGKDLTITLTTDDTRENVLKFYQEGLQRHAWKVSVTDVPRETLSARKPGRECNVTVDPNPFAEGLLIGITVTPISSNDQ